MDVHGQSGFIRKRSGIGGTGGRQLSPELRMRFGTYGFRKKNPERKIKSKENLYYDDYSNSNTLQAMS